MEEEEHLTDVILYVKFFKNKTNNSISSGC